MVADAGQYTKDLTDEERRVFRHIIGLLAILDSVQPKFFNSVVNVLSDDSYSALAIIVAQQEVVHNHSYTYILSSVEDKENQDLAFETARTVKEVYERNDLIISYYEDFINKQTVDSLVKALIASVALEGINFYSGFAFFYSLARRQLMVGASTMISYIQRDELPHQVLSANILKTIIEEHPEEITFDVSEFAHELYTKVVDAEINWSTHILANIKGIDEDEMTDYIKYRANKCLSLMGIEPLYEDVDNNSMPWIRAYVSEDEDKGLTKTDFFEQRSREYAKVSDDNGFDDL